MIVWQKFLCPSNTIFIQDDPEKILLKTKELNCFNSNSSLNGQFSYDGGTTINYFGIFQYF